MAAQRNPNGNKFTLPPGYKDLGWQLINDPAVSACSEAGHKRRYFDNSLYLCRGSDRITICDECKYVYHTDST